MDVLNRKEIAKGVFLSCVTDSRFKQNRISVTFLTQLDKEKASANAVVAKILTNSCCKYPDLQSLNKRLSKLYAASLMEGTGSLGDTQEIELSIKTLDSRYALDGEDVMSEGVDILLDCIFDPLIENGIFKDSVVNAEKQATIDQIEAEFNEKRTYAVKRAKEILFKGEIASVQHQGTVEGVKSLTAELLFKTYENLLKTARIEISCVGCSDFSGIDETFAKAFSTISREEIEDCYSTASVIKQREIEYIETLDVSQSKMVLGFKMDSTDIDALALMTKIYGGSATSKLFENVREKLSLCYYCWGRFHSHKKAMLVECGVEKENINKAREEILNQFNKMKVSDFSDDELNQAVLSLKNDLKVVNDSLSGINRWYLDHIYKCDIITPEQAIERYEKITREQIVNAAKSVKLELIYILTDRGNSKGEGNQ